VYVPQGSFYLGDGTTTDITGQFSAHNTSNPFQITGEGQLTLGGSSAGNLGNNNASGMLDGFRDDFNFITRTLPSAYPKGYSAFYCQKYEIAQQQYVDFLNTLTRTQQNSRTETNLAEGIDWVDERYVMSKNEGLQIRNGIRCNESIHSSDPITFCCDLDGDGIGGENNDGQWIACNYLSWMDEAAYSDWAGLRPMTELEYEKACRGTATPVADEYAWGNTTATAANNITNPGAASETTNTQDANVVFNYDGNNENVIGPMRVGVFAKSATNRVQSGASYYGIMELSGNLWEHCVTVGNATGRTFTGLHGNGVLSTNGHANVTFWPGLSGGEVTGANGCGTRGGNWKFNHSIMRTSARTHAAHGVTDRYDDLGFRLVRQNP